GGAEGARDIVEIGGEPVPLCEVGGVDAVVEDHRAARQPEENFAGQVVSQCGAQIGDGVESDSALVARLGSVKDILRAGKDRAGGSDVDAVRTAHVGLIGISVGKVVFGCYVVIQFSRVEAAIVSALALEIQVIAVVVAVG